MNRIFFIIAVALTATIAIGGIVYAGGGGGMGGGGMGSGGHGMMGGGNMMDYGRGYSIPSPDQYNRYNRSDEPYQYGPRETKRLRQEITEKRQELSKLYDSEKPDKDLIKKKIDELDKLEAELDHRLSATQYQRR
jgi:Spy/CpxP family protein refolding chaperone